MLPSAEYPAPATVERLTHEYGLRELLDSAWAARPLELVREGGRTMLLLEQPVPEPPGGVPLERFIGDALDMGRFLELAIATSAALRQMHRRGLVHRDIKPANILVDPASNEIWLTGFGIASSLPRERPLPSPPELLAGTLAYMAPEQTGRMNRSIDSRCDLYSLGVTLYQLLTGQLPFTASEPLEWVHCHLARKPLPLKARSGEIPAPVSSILSKLLAKTPEDRYQSAEGVEHDLKRCLEAWKGARSLENFPIAERDTAGRLLISERLYGREAEVARLSAAFRAVVDDGIPLLVLVHGPPGIGKSSVINELHRALVPSEGTFTSSKLEKLESGGPYAALAEALRELVRRLLGRPETELEPWRRALRRALAPSSALITALVPELKFILGEQAPAPDAPAPAAPALFQLLLLRLIGVFTRPERPLALLIDDLQSLDAPTHDLLVALLLQTDLRNLIVVGAHRDMEPSGAHPLLDRLPAIRASGVRVLDIGLLPLTQENLTQLIADTLRCETARALPLANVIHDKTAGNPFFSKQFLATLLEEELLVFDPERARWSWDLRSIEDRSHAENVVELLVAKLNRLPVRSQDALKELALLGTVAEARVLAIAHATSEEKLDADLGEALCLGLVVRSGTAYRFAHDRVEEAAYSLLPAASRAEAHLGLGRALLGQLRENEREAAAFLLVRQLNRGSLLVSSQDERELFAELNLMAGKRARLAAAFASALTYLAAGAALFGSEGWARHRVLGFELEFYRAECEFLTGAIGSAETRLVALASRANDAAERAQVTCLLADVYVALRKLDLSVAACLGYLRAQGLAIPALPSAAEARAAYARVWAALGDRPVEALVELPFLTDPTSRATLDVLAKVVRCAGTQLSEHLLSLVLCAAVELSIERGHCDSSCYVYEYFGANAAWQFGDFEAGFRFGRLGLDLVERKDLRQFEALVCLTFANRILPWSKHVESGRELLRNAFDLANKSGDRITAASSCCVLVSNLLLSGVPLGEVQKEAEAGQRFCRRAAFRDFVAAADVQSAFIRNLRGLTRSFGRLDGVDFDERRAEADFETLPHAPVFECWYWIRLLQARYLAGDYGAAFAASKRALPLLSSSRALLEAVEYEFFAALTHAELCGAASAEERTLHFEALSAHRGLLERWAQNCPQNFEARAVLVAAEVARLEADESRAMRLYEQAIRSARDNGFVHDEGLATELAARFYAERGFDKIARAYLRDARSCYLQWGAAGKVRSLEERHPHLVEEERRLEPKLTSLTPFEHLELATVLKVLQAVSGEIEPRDLIATVMRLGLSHAGAARGLLILPGNGAYRVEAEALIEGSEVAVIQQQKDLAASDLPLSVFQYVIRTRERVLLNDAASVNAFSEDEYWRKHRARSVLCVPLLKQARLVGVIYLENDLAPGVFTPARLAVTELLASEAAVSLDNGRLYAELQKREARLRRLVEANVVGIVIASLDGRIVEANDEFLRMLGYGREELGAGNLRWVDMTPVEWRETAARRVAELRKTGVADPHEMEFVKKDGGRVPVLVGTAMFDDWQNEGVAFVVDLTDRKQAEEAARESERRYNEIRAQLAHANRVATVGQLSASIAHEVNQPLAGVLVNASTCLHMLAASPPNIGGASETARRVIRDANRASDVIRRLRALFTKTDSPSSELLDLNGTVGEVLALFKAELQTRRILTQVRLESALPPVRGDRTQLQQLLLNLVRNAVDALSALQDDPRQLSIRTETAGANVRVAVEDTGPGVDPGRHADIFDAFYSTKPDGLGVGLSICRAIVEAHGGKLSVHSASPRGAVFRVELPAA